MTKRFNNYPGNHEKKLKLEEECWDDVDDEALNECFEIASQAYDYDIAKPSENDITHLPSYSAFKYPNGFSTSTQANQNIPSTSTKKFTLHELQVEVNKLKRDNEEKNGEISILRSKIKETSTTIQVQQQKTVSEWREKLQVSEKEVNSFKSQLEFKNLEIANLKQHLAEVKRAHLESNTTSHFVTTESVVKVNCERNMANISRNYVEPSCKQVVIETVYPLQNLSLRLFDDFTTEKHIIMTPSYKLSRNTIPYLQNQHSTNQTYCQHKCVLKERFKTLADVSGDLLKLINSESSELNGSGCIEPVTNIIYFTLVHLSDLNDYLEKCELYLNTDNIQQADKSYLLTNNINFASTNCVENDELGMKASQLIDFLSQVILYSKYLEEYVCCQGKLKQVALLGVYKDLILCEDSNNQLLILLLRLLKRIGRCRKAPVMCSFLISVTNLLTNIGKLDCYNCDSALNRDLIHTLLKELIFVRPGAAVIQKFTNLLKIYSQSRDFIQFLFSNRNKDPLKSNFDDIIYYTEDSCVFCVLSFLLQDILKLQLPLETCHNMISFLYNTFKTIYWIHEDNTEDVCSCISQLYTLEIECVFKSLESFTVDFKNRKENYERWQIFLRHEVIQTVLNLLNFSYYKLTEKYILVYCQFKECEQILKEHQLDITELNTTEDSIKICENAFRADF